MALTEPPVEVAAMTPPINIMACHGSMPNVNGISRATAVVPPSPGMAPNSNPTAEPAASNSRECGELRLTMPSINASNTDFLAPGDLL